MRNTWFKYTLKMDNKLYVRKIKINPYNLNSASDGVKNELVPKERLLNFWNNLLEQQKLDGVEIISVVILGYPEV